MTARTSKNKKPQILLTKLKDTTADTLAAEDEEYIDTLFHCKLEAEFDRKFGSTHSEVAAGLDGIFLM